MAGCWGISTGPTLAAKVAKLSQHPRHHAAPAKAVSLPFGCLKACHFIWHIAPILLLAWDRVPAALRLHALLARDGATAGGQAEGWQLILGTGTC
jgi:hypothetical protein